jgi:hypothetical protein
MPLAPRWQPPRPPPPTHTPRRTCPPPRSAHSAQLEEQERRWRARGEALQARAAAEAGAAEQRWAGGAAEAEGRWRSRVEALGRSWAAEQGALEAEWAARLEEAHERWLQVGRGGGGGAGGGGGLSSPATCPPAPAPPAAPTAAPTAPAALQLQIACTMEPGPPADVCPPHPRLPATQQLFPLPVSKLPPPPPPPPPPQEKEKLEGSWAERMAQVQEAAARRFDVLQQELEAKVRAAT